MGYAPRSNDIQRIPQPRRSYKNTVVRLLHLFFSLSTFLIFFSGAENFQFLMLGPVFLVGLTHIGPSTEVIAGEGHIITAGGIDSHIHFHH